MHCGAEVTESSTNKQHHLSSLVLGVRDCMVVVWGATPLKAQSTPVREFFGG